MKRRARHTNAPRTGAALLVVLALALAGCSGKATEGDGKGEDAGE